MNQIASLWKLQVFKCPDKIIALGDYLLIINIFSFSSLSYGLVGFHFCNSVNLINMSSVHVSSEFLI